MMPKWRPRPALLPVHMVSRSLQYGSTDIRPVAACAEARMIVFFAKKLVRKVLGSTRCWRKLLCLDFPSGPGKEVG